MLRKKKVIVTGTGRCGTTYLMRLFTRLKLDTGFTSENMDYIKDVNVFLNNNKNAKKKMMSIFFLSSGFLLIYLLFMLKRKAK